MAELYFTSLESDSNLLAYYRFSNGGLTSDSGTYGRTLYSNGTVSNTALGKYGYGANLGSRAGSMTNGTDMFSASNLNHPFSLACWIYPTDTSNQSFINFGTQQQQEVSHFGYDGTQFLFQMSGWGAGGTVGVTYTATLQTNSWTHVAMTFDGSTMTGYVNGAAVASASVSIPHGNTTPNVGISVGGDGASLSTANFPGVIDDAVYMFRALTAQEVKQLAVDGTGAIYYELLN